MWPFLTKWTAHTINTGHRTHKSIRQWIHDVIVLILGNLPTNQLIVQVRVPSNYRVMSHVSFFNLFQDSGKKVILCRVCIVILVWSTVFMTVTAIFNFTFGRVPFYCVVLIVCFENPQCFSRIRNYFRVFVVVVGIFVVWNKKIEKCAWF